jgi:hypothetical protein
LSVWADSDGAVDPVLQRDLAIPGFEGAAPAEIVQQVLGGDAVEAREPLLETAVNVSSASTIPVGFCGLSAAGAPKKR